MQLISLYLKNFRCFSEKYIELDNPLVLLQGLNGSGKTSLIEAMHYLCYLRSFKTHSPRDLLHFGQDNFFLKAAVRPSGAYDELPLELQVGYSGKKRLVKINQQTIVSYKDLMDHYRVVTLTEDDGDLVKSGPEARRAFIDQALMLEEPAIAPQLRMLKHLVESRNALLNGGCANAQSLEIWTHKVWEQTAVVRQARKALLSKLETEVVRILGSIDATLQVAFRYLPKNIDADLPFEQFMDSSRVLFSEETRYGRSLFGAHLDDFSITLQDRLTRQFASRGQQKLLVLLLKIAQVTHLISNRGSVIFLLDDFITDFDDRRALQLLSPLIALGGQLIFTCPSMAGALHNQLASRDAKILTLTD